MHRCLTWRLTTPIACAALAAGALGATATPALAGWSKPRALEPGTDPMIAVGPTGDEAVASNRWFQRNTANDGADMIRVVTRRPGRAFGVPRRSVRVRATQVGGDTESLAGLAVSNAGTVGAVFAVDQRRSDGAMGEPVDALVLPRGAKRFARPQQIGKVGNAAADYEDPNETAIVSTARGELVEASIDDNGRSATAVLAPGHTRFAIRQPASAQLESTALLAPDDAGGTFMAGLEGDEDNLGCVTAAYRPAHGAFRTRYVTSPCSKHNPNREDGLVAAGRAGAALVTDGEPHDQAALFVQVGRSGAFGTPAKLSTNGIPLGVDGVNDYTAEERAPGGDGVAADRDGRVTTAWQGCTTGTDACTTKGIYAETGTISAGFTHGATLLAPSRKGTKLSGIVADGAVAWQRCAKGRPCTVSAALAAGSGFGPPRTVTRNASELVGLYGDQRGDLMLVWVDKRGAVYAALRPASARGFGRSRRVAGPGVSRKTVTGAVGPGGHDIVAWSGHGKTSAVIDDPGH